MNYPEDMMQAAREAAKHGPEMWVSLSNGQYCTKEISKDELLQVALYAIATERARNTWQFTDGEIEKIAKAICAARNDEYNGWENLETSEKDQFIIEAKSAASVILDAPTTTT